MSNPRDFLNNPIASGSLLSSLLGQSNLWNMQNLKWAETKGGTYSNNTPVAVASLSYIPLFTGSTIYYAAWINGRVMWYGYVYYPSAFKNGVDVSSWQYFRSTGGDPSYPDASQGTSMITSFANPASGTAIALSVNIQSSGNPTYPYYNHHAGVVAWEVVG